MKRTKLITKLKATKSRLIQQIVQLGPALRGREEERADYRARILFLEEQIRDLRQGENKKTLFISYSEDLHDNNLALIRTLAEKNFAFRVRTGFDYSNIGSILKRVRTGIEDTACFLSIMTPRFQVIDPAQSRSGAPAYAPSIWVIEEKGMALALGKPFHLLISGQIHPDFWQKTSPHRKHTIFDDADFELRSNEALDALNERYTQMVLEQALLR